MSKLKVHCCTYPIQCTILTVFATDPQDLSLFIQYRVQFKISVKSFWLPISIDWSLMKLFEWRQMKLFFVANMVTLQFKISTEVSKEKISYPIVGICDWFYYYSFWWFHHRRSLDLFCQVKDSKKIWVYWEHIQMISY